MGGERWGCSWGQDWGYVSWGQDWDYVCFGGNIGKPEHLTPICCRPNPGITELDWESEEKVDVFIEECEELVRQGGERG